MSRYLAHKFETPFLMAAKESGCPIMSQMDESTAGAMWKEAQVTIYQQRKINKYLRATFGSKVIVPEKKIRSLGDNYIKPTFGHYNYKKKNSKKESERCDYWTVDIAEYICAEIEKLISKEGDEFNSYEMPGGRRGWEIVFGADHGKGSWKSVVKLFYRSYKHRKERIESSKTNWTSDSMESNIGYFTFQNAHVDCKKDNSEVLRNTTTPTINDNINQMLNSRLLTISISTDECKNNKQYKAILVSKHSIDVQIGTLDSCGNINLEYKIVDPVAGLIVSMNEPLCKAGQNAVIVLDIPCFNIYMTGDLAFYADVLGKPNSSTYWCHLCMLSWKEWNVEGHEKGELWTLEKLQQSYKKYCDENRSSAVLGVSESAHYQICPQLYVCPSLHILIGLVNKIWSELKANVEEKYENIDSEEMKARNLVEIQTQVLDNSIKERDENSKTIAVEIKAIKVSIQESKRELQKLTDEQEQEESQQLIDALRFELQMKSQQVKDGQKDVDKNRALLKKAKDNVLTLRASRGWSPESIETAIEQILKAINVHAEAYHGGDFNGKSCRLLLDNTKSVMDQITVVVVERRRKESEESDACVFDVMKNYENLMGKLDAVLAQLTIINPSEDKIRELESMVNSFMKLWRDLGISVTTKAHLIEDHIVDQTRSLCGVGGDKAEHHIEKQHQDFSRGLTVTRNIKKFSDRTQTQLRNVKICQHASIIRAQQNITNASKRKRSNDNVKDSQMRKEQKISVKKEKRNEYAEL